MPRQPFLKLAALTVAATLLAACGDGRSDRAVCSDDQECVGICQNFGHPSDGATCTSEGYCVCRDPQDVGDTADLADTTADLDPVIDDADADDLQDATPDVGDVQDDDSEVSDVLDMTPDDGTTGRCPEGTVDLGDVCMDRYEAPNDPSALPLVMYDFNEAEAWCNARGKRLCYDDEWLDACEGAAGSAYPYGDEYDPGRCNDEEVWRVYSQTSLNGWPLDAAAPDVETLEDLLNRARAEGQAGLIAADHVAELYQGEGSGLNDGCTNETGVFDLVGNVEEWTRRRDGGDGSQFLGNLKGRYWAESRTCQSNVTTHGNGFRFYEIGFRCCADPIE